MSWVNERGGRAGAQAGALGRGVSVLGALGPDADMVGDGDLLARLRRLADPALRHPLVTR